MTPAVIWQAFMLKAHAGLPVRHFDGAPSFADSSDDLPIENPEKEKNPKKKPDAHGKETETKGTHGTEKSEASVNAASSARSAPSEAEAPEPGMGVEKGRN